MDEGSSSSRTVSSLVKTGENGLYLSHFSPDLL